MQISIRGTESDNKMESKLTIKKDYILVKPKAYEFQEIIGCIARLFNMPENREKNVIWLFEEGPLNITYDELFKIKDFVKENLPENEKPDKKTAVVIKSGFLSAMAQIFSEISKNLYLNYKVFSDLTAAEEWIIDK